MQRGSNLLRRPGADHLLDLRLVSERLLFGLDSWKFSSQTMEHAGSQENHTVELHQKSECSGKFGHLVKNLEANTDTEFVLSMITQILLESECDVQKAMSAGENP